jgi:predicted NAD/FAD-dependent oxidoreductase
MSKKIGRRHFIEKALLSGVGLTMLPYLLSSCKIKMNPVISQVDNSQKGHLLRDFKFPEPTSSIEIDTVILGAGISGLSAAYSLSKSGFSEYKILELDEFPGGNAQSRSNEVCAYPLGAHYLPIVNNHDKELISFLHEHNIIVGFDERGLPRYNEQYLCADPDERLFCDGIWQDGLIPQITTTPEEKNEITKFLSQMQEFKTAKGSDNKYYFDLPLDLSSKDEKVLSLDEITMAEWMKEQGYESTALLWYINYCCRDDYGTRADETSAWAAIHYFTGRKSQAANAESDAVLTWPEGNNFLVNCLLSKIPLEKINLNAVVFHLDVQENQIEVFYYSILENKSIRVVAKNCIDALPLFVHKKFSGNVNAVLQPFQNNISYAPWLVANLTLNATLNQERGAVLAWDNVIMNDQSLGYVNASHQLLQSRPTQYVLTYYKPLCDLDPKTARQNAHSKSKEELTAAILDELKKVHADLDEKLISIELKLWGHAMIRPTVKSLWTDRLERNKKLQSTGIHFAHCDHSGISLFEEAFHQGLNAAKKIMEVKA